MEDANIEVLVNMGLLNVFTDLIEVPKGPADCIYHHLLDEINEDGTVSLVVRLITVCKDNKYARQVGEREQTVYLRGINVYKTSGMS